MSVHNHVHVDDDLWFEPAEEPESGVVPAQDPNVARILHPDGHWVDARIVPSPFEELYDRNSSNLRADDDPEVAHKLNFSREGRKVGLTEVKTYSSLFLILQDLEFLLHIWKERTRHPAHLQYAQGVNVSEGTNLKEAKHGIFLEKSTHSLHAKEQNIVISSVCFLEVFKNEHSYSCTMTTLRCMKRQVLQQMHPILNELMNEDRLTLEIWESIWPYVISDKGHRLRLKVNVKRGDKAVLEDDLITDAFGAAANFVQVILDILFLAGSFQDVELVSLITKMRHVFHNLKCKFSALMHLVGNNEQADASDLVSLMKRGHYTIKQLQLKSYRKRQEGSMSICGESETLLIGARILRDKTILTLWNKPERRVASTIPLCNFGSSRLSAYVIQEELFVIMLGSAYPDYFIFFAIRCEISTDGSSPTTSLNSWPHPVTMREVVTSGSSQDVTFHIFEEGNGSLAWLAIFRDDTGPNIAFFDPVNGAEIGRERVTPKCATLQAVKDNSAVFLDHDKGLFIVYKLSKKNTRVLARLYMHTLLSIPDGEEECKYKKSNSKMAAFDLSNDNHLMLISPNGERVVLDIESLKVKSVIKRILPMPLLEEAFKEECTEQNTVLGRPQCVDARMQRHCLVDGVLFFLAQDRRSFHLRALDLRSEDRDVATVDICGFAKYKLSSLEGLSLIQAVSFRYPQDNCNHLVPYAFAKTSKEFDACSENCISNMWTLWEDGRYRLHYCRQTETLFMAGIGDGNFVEVKVLRENSVGIRAKLAAKRRSIQAMWKNKEKK